MMDWIFTFLFFVFLAIHFQPYNVKADDINEDECECSKNCSTVFSIFSGHTACIAAAVTANPIEITSAMKTEIVDEHNRLRGQVNPVATDMLKITWDDELAMLAQKWTDACTMQHDTVRDIPGRVTVGQNLAIGQADFKAAIAAWYSEESDYTYGVEINMNYNGPAIGHYTQIVWAQTNKIGCGLTECSGSKYYICNYAPGGNVYPFTGPYETGTTRCGDCQTCDSGLCDCGDLLCKNGGTLKTDTCTCDCENPTHHIGATCDLSCDAADLSACGKTGFEQSRCSSAYVQWSCPHQCGLCPCAEADYTNDKCDSAFMATSSILTLTLTLIVSLAIF